MIVDHYIEFKQEVCSIEKTIRDNGGWVRTQTSISTRSSSIELKVYQKKHNVPILKIQAKGYFCETTFADDSIMGQMEAVILYTTCKQSE